MQVKNIAVHNKQQNIGIGRMLMNRAEREARANSCVSISLYTNECMSENIEWYITLGFVEYARQNIDGYKRVFFEKILL
jgi:ribosomal protein S18 acetylase RimI-like enzyme